ncbi:MAG: choice-of-anchor Q domain-containing protein, partial [Saprospiraceae bacterium]
YDDYFICYHMKVKANNCLFTAPMYYYAGPVTGPNVQINVDPLFVDTLNGDFHLRPCSPAWNAGDNAGAQGNATDLDGRPRIIDDIVDIGAYEVPALGNAGPVAVKAACFGQPQGAVYWNLENGCPPYTYHWTLGSTTGTNNTALPPGNYQFTVTDSRGRNLVQTVPVPGSSPEVQLSGDTLICPATPDGDLLALVSGAIEPVQYHWSTGSQAGSISGLGVGAYSVTVTDAIGCQDQATATVGSLSIPLGLSILNMPASSQNAADGSLLVTVQTGQGPFTYAWAEVVGTGPGITGLLPGSYHLSITDGAGCVTPLEFVVGALSATADAEATLPGSVWPNPAREQVVLRFGDATSWQLFRLNGEEVLGIEAPAPGQSLPVRWNGLPAGIYFYTFSHNGQVLGRDRLVILAP